MAQRWRLSVSGWSCCSGACGEAAHHGGISLWHKLPTSWHLRTKTVRKRLTPHMPLPGTATSNLRPPLGPTSKSSSTSQWYHGLGNTSQSTVHLPPYPPIYIAMRNSQGHLAKAPQSCMYICSEVQMKKLPNWRSWLWLFSYLDLNLSSDCVFLGMAHCHPILPQFLNL